MVKNQQIKTDSEKICFLLYMHKKDAVFPELQFKETMRRDEMSGKYKKVVRIIQISEAVFW